MFDRREMRLWWIAVVSGPSKRVAERSPDRSEMVCTRHCVLHPVPGPGGWPLVILKEFMQVKSYVAVSIIYQLSEDSSPLILSRTRYKCLPAYY